MAYLLGSVSFAVITSRCMGLQDPRGYGSGNPGATNVLRGGNKTAAALTLLGDCAKGWLAVGVARHWDAPLGEIEVRVAVTATAVFLGHLYPVFFRFRGGKGVATALGVLLAMNGLLGLGVLVVWVTIFAVSRLSSLAALGATAAAAIGSALLWETQLWALTIWGISALLVWRHRGNIHQLLAGTESGIGKKPPIPPPT